MFTSSVFSEYLQRWYLVKNARWVVIGCMAIGLFLAIGGMGWLLLMPSSTSSSEEFELDQPPPAQVVTQEASPVLETLAVEVSGAVAKPGVYTFQTGDRVLAAIQAAGGLTREASPNFVRRELNLAQLLTDQMKLYIPTFSEDTASLSHNSSANQPLPTESQSGLISLNQATKAELDSLPGIGEARATKIIENRPYSQIEELVSRQVVSQSLFDKLKDAITI